METYERIIIIHFGSYFSSNPKFSIISEVIPETYYWHVTPRDSIFISSSWEFLSSESDHVSALIIWHIVTSNNYQKTTLIQPINPDKTKHNELLSFLSNYWDTDKTLCQKLQPSSSTFFFLSNQGRTQVETNLYWNFLICISGDLH